MTEVTRFAGWPRCGASAVVFRGAEVLLIQRAKGTFTGLWSFPGGHVEPGEPARTAAAREVLEETGVTADLQELLDVHDIIVRDGAGALTVHYVISCYWGFWRGGDAVASTDARAARFWSLDDIDTVPATEGTARLVRQAAQRAELMAHIGRS